MTKMTHGETYRANADAQRAAAEKASLANRRAMHEQSAMVWDEMADAAEEHLIKQTVNAVEQEKWRSGKPRRVSEEHTMVPIDDRLAGLFGS